MVESSVAKIIQDIADKTGYTFEQIYQIYLAPFKMVNEALDDGILETIEIPRVFKLAPKKSIVNRLKKQQKTNKDATKQ